MKYFATAIPGIAPLLREELAELRGVEVEPDRWFDGRNDLVPFTAPGSFRPSALRTSEDVYAEVARTPNPGRLSVLIPRLWNAEGAAAALSAFSLQNRPLRTRQRFRVVARVLIEDTFPRTRLREEMAAFIMRSRPRWVRADPAELEIWVMEVRRDYYALGVRLTTSEMRHRGGRTEERSGALRPTVAAAMVRLAGAPSALPLLDPCCGSGNILAEAQSAGWRCLGGDIDPRALHAARENLRGVSLLQADCRQIPLGTGSVRALVSNLPFGMQFPFEGPPEAWMDAMLAEAARVTDLGGAVVLLAPSNRDVRPPLERARHLRVLRQIPIDLLGARAVIWEFRRDLEESIC